MVSSQFSLIHFAMLPLAISAPAGGLTGYDHAVMAFSTMYLMPKNERHARRTVIIPLVGGIVGPIIWIIPPLVATVMFSGSR